MVIVVLSYNQNKPFLATVHLRVFVIKGTLLTLLQYASTLLKILPSFPWLLNGGRGVRGEGGGLSSCLV